jgi:hypothetical protein
LAHGLEAKVRSGHLMVQMHGAFMVRSGHLTVQMHGAFMDARSGVTDRLTFFGGKFLCVCPCSLML